MAVYLSIPIFDELVRCVENGSTDENTVKAMSFGLLNYYFSATNGYAVAPKQERKDDPANFTILRIQRRFPGDRGVVVHTIAQVENTSDSLEASLEELENVFDSANTEFGRCWALMIYGRTFLFYEYHRTRPEHTRLIPWGPPNQEPRNSFHVLHDSVVIEWMLRHMSQNNHPPAREEI